jgi:hypothetical protein
MHGRSFNRILSDTGARSAYNRNTGDYTSFSVITRHQLGRDLPFWGAALNAGLDLKRESQTYSRYYLSSRINGFDTIRNNGDNDRINMRLSLDYRVCSFKPVDLNLRCEYSHNLTSFIRAARSGSNSIDSMLLIGGSTEVRPVEQLTVRYSARAQVDMTRFIYPLLHTAPSERPPYSRLFNSHMALEWKVSAPLEATVEWVEGYADYGKWYGSEYFSADSTSADSAVQAYDYYAILNIAQNHTVKASVRYKIKNIGSVAIGCEYSDLYYREWNPVIGIYEVGKSDSDYRIDPFIEAKIAAGPAVNLGLRFKPVLISTSPSLDSVVVQYWNFAVQGKVLF